MLIACTVILESALVLYFAVLYLHSMLNGGTKTVRRRYGKIISTKAIIDQQNGCCKGM